MSKTTHHRNGRLSFDCTTDTELLCTEYENIKYDGEDVSGEYFEYIYNKLDYESKPCVGNFLVENSFVTSDGRKFGCNEESFYSALEHEFCLNYKPKNTCKFMNKKGE